MPIIKSWSALFSCSNYFVPINKVNTSKVLPRIWKCGWCPFFWWELGAAQSRPGLFLFSFLFFSQFFERRSLYTSYLVGPWERPRTFWKYLIMAPALKPLLRSAGISGREYTRMLKTTRDLCGPLCWRKLALLPPLFDDMFCPSHQKCSTTIGQTSFRPGPVLIFAFRRKYVIISIFLPHVEWKWKMVVTSADLIIDTWFNRGFFFFGVFLLFSRKNTRFLPPVSFLQRLHDDHPARKKTWLTWERWRNEFFFLLDWLSGFQNL